MHSPSRASPPREAVSALLLAAGQGARAGGGGKAFLEHEGKSLLELALGQAALHCGHLLVGLDPSDFYRAESILRRYQAVVVAGGAERQDTLDALLERTTTEFALVCDVARPALPDATLAALIAGLGDADAVAPVLNLRLRESLAVLDGDGRVRQVLPRDSLAMTQTPQLFRTAALVDALAQADRQGWNEVSLLAIMTRAGYAVTTVVGDRDNVKITYPEDLDLLK